MYYHKYQQMMTEEIVSVIQRMAISRFDSFVRLVVMQNSYDVIFAD
jgi:hypothetical protein